MTRWSPQHYLKGAVEACADPTVVRRALSVAEEITARNPYIYPVFTLRHLSFLANVEYGTLRSIVSRGNQNPYRVFRVRKRPREGQAPRYRVIAVPSPALMKTQRWIVNNILVHATPHPASTAYSKGCKLLDAASPHCGASWLIKLDVRNFFESISEIAVYRVFRSLGYQALPAFELTRLCTRLGSRTRRRSNQTWEQRHLRPTISSYANYRIGHLPQGAPTSPMLANLAVKQLDLLISRLALEHGFNYTRYADDLTLSSMGKSLTRNDCRSLIGKVYAIFGRFGFSPNVSKTQIVPPGSRKIVLGLLVDGRRPKLQREFKAKLRQHLFFLQRTDVGPVSHARVKGFASVLGLKHHVLGLALFARQIEPEYGAEVLAELNAVDWPI